MARNFTFVTSHDRGPRPRPIRSRKACDSCRHKKRRCHHQLRPASGGSPPSPPTLVWMEPDSTQEVGGMAPAVWETPRDKSISPNRLPITPQQEQTDLQGHDAHEDEHLQHPSEGHSGPGTPRFVSDLNPEARLLDETTTPEEGQDMGTGEVRVGVGVWVQPRLCSKCGISKTCSAAAAPLSTETGDSRTRPPVSDLLPVSTVRTLSEMYFTNMHPMLPLLNEEEYWQSLSQGTIPMPLVHVVCLLAAKSHGAGQHLKLLQTGDALVPAREFCSHLYSSLMIALSQRTSIKKITLIRILGLLSLHQEGSGGVDQASSCITQAMHYAQGLALHLPRPNDVTGELKRTFWCLWTLDRLNAVLHSRPCMMADMDIAVLDPTPEQTGSVAFDVWFRISKTLNTVIGLYRPRAEHDARGWDSGFPVFEQIMDEAGAWDLSPSTIATLHIFYLTTAILSHRLKTITTLPSPTPSRLRQQLCTIQVIRYMQTRYHTLHPFPVTVYAASLALSVSYQQLRYSRLSSDQEDARRDFNEACKTLQQLRKTWWSADAMASLAHRTSGALDRLPCLDLLRVNRSDPSMEGHARLAEKRGPESPEEGRQDQGVVDLHLAQHHPQGPVPGAEAMDLFAGMDDVSWMYLDGELPFTFDSFPILDSDEPFDTW